MLSKQTARETVRKLVSYTKNYAKVSIWNDGDNLTRFANSEIHQNVEIENISVGLTVYNGRKEASCSTNVLTEEGLRDLAADADALLALSPDTEYDVIELQGGEVRDAVNDERLAEAFGVTKRAEIIKSCIETLDPDFTASGVLNLNNNMYALGDSNGIFKYYSFDSADFNAVVTHKDGAAGYGETGSHNLDNIDIAKAFKSACEKAKMAVNPQFADIGAYTVILEPAAVAGLMGFVLGGLSGAGILRETSFAAGKLGEKIFGDNITLRDDLSSPVAQPVYFDGEGYAHKPMTFIEKGVIRGFYYDGKTAQKSGVEPTGQAFWGAGSLTMEGGNSSLEEMIKSTKRGLLITRFHYTNYVNPKKLQVTGLTRDGTFMIEDGKIAYPVNNMRFTEDMISAFSNVAALSKELTKAGGLFPAAKIENFHFTGGQK